MKGMKKSFRLISHPCETRAMEGMTAGVCLRDSFRNRRSSAIMIMKTISKAVSVLMVGIMAAGMLISCEGNAVAPAPEEVVVSAFVNDETKSLEARVEQDGKDNGYSDAAYNNITHYKWIMKTDSPARVYDSGYITRAEAEAGRLYANPYDEHQIVTGNYHYDFYGYVYDDINNKYLQVAEAHADNVLVNAKTTNISITLEQLSNGENGSAELKNLGTIIYAQLPVDFYKANLNKSDNLEVKFRGTYKDVGGVMSDAADFSAIVIAADASDRQADAGKNIVKLTIADKLPTGSYRIEVTATLVDTTKTDTDPDYTIDTKLAVDILRSIGGTMAIGDMNFASTTLNEDLVADLTDKVGDHIAISAKDGKLAFTITGSENDSEFVLTLNDPVLQNTVPSDPSALKAVWYLNGAKMESNAPSVGTSTDGKTPYTFAAHTFSEGVNILSVTFVDERYQMSAGSATFEVTVNPERYYVRISPVGAINCRINEPLRLTAELVDNETGLAVPASWAWTSAAGTGSLDLTGQETQAAKANPIFVTTAASAGDVTFTATATIDSVTATGTCVVTFAN